MLKVIRKITVRFEEEKFTAVAEISNINPDYYGMPAVWVKIRDKKTGKVLGSQKINLAIKGGLPD